MQESFDEELEQSTGRKKKKHLSVSRLVPNFITIMGMCAGLSAIRFALTDQWKTAVIAILVAAVLDGTDGRVARLLKATSNFGAQLDSLSDFVSFGVAPAIVMYLWTMHDVRGIGWVMALFFAVCAAVRLARFNSDMFEPDNESWSDRYFKGIPAPMGGCLALLPMVMTFETGTGVMDHGWISVLYLGGIALLMASRIPTFSLKRMKIRLDYAIPLMVGVGLAVALLIMEPWFTLIAIGVGYIATIPLSISQRKKELSTHKTHVTVTKP